MPFCVRINILAFLLMAPTAWAIGSASSLKDTPASETEDESEAANEIRNGRVLVLVFQNGLPQANTRLRIAGKTISVDKNGIASLELTEGRHLIEPEGYGGQGTAFTVVANEETELIINLLPRDQFISQDKTPSTTSGQRLSDLKGVPLRLQLRSAGKALAEANVLVAGFSGLATSNQNGEVDLNLPPGPYAFTILHKNAETLVVQDSVRAEGGLAKLGPEPVLELKATDTFLEEYVVLAPKVKGSVAALVEVRRNSAAVADVLGSEQMARQGDSDAAASLRRVTGLTLVGGKFVYVRGLGERYSAVTLNGSSLPSPEPARRVVPLDLFPTSVLESVVVQKSFSSDLPGEFGGGLIQLKTKSLPDKPFIKLGLSTTLQNTKEGLSYEGGSTDWLGRDDGKRAMPAAIKNALLSGKRLDVNNPPAFTDGFSQEDLTALGRSLPNVYNVKAGRKQSPPGISLAAGNRWGNKAFSVGGAISGLHASSTENALKTTKKYDIGSGNNLEESESALTQQSSSEVKTSAGLDLGVEIFKRHKIETHWLLVRDTSNEVNVKNFSRKSDSRAQRRTTSLEWVERELLTGQLVGHHFFPTQEESGVEWDWHGSRSNAKRNAPDTREYSYEQREAGENWTLTTDATGNRRSWSELGDLTQEVGSDLTLPFSLASWGSVKAKLGASYITRKRDSDTWRLHLRSLSGSGVDYAQSPEQLWAPDNFGSAFQLTNLTDTADSMSGTQDLTSVYSGLQWNPSPLWTLSSGFRRESSRQIVKTFYYYSRNTPESSAGLVTTDLLPAHSLTWKPNDSWRARLAYSETVARPEFRELSTVPFIDDESGYETVGNSNLKGTVIRNYDHRWEFYPSPEESFSVGVFMKEFIFPIEETFEPSDNLRKTYQNAAGARNFGVELDSRFDLRNISRFLRRWSVLGNLSLIRSRIQLDPQAGGLQTSSVRPLQGQSPWVVNTQLQYERPVQGSTFSFVYNAVGPRITEVGTSLRPDIYEQPFHQLDFVAAQKFYKTWTLGFKAKNLLDPESKSTQGENIVRTIKKGRSLHVSLAANF